MDRKVNDTAVGVVRVVEGVRGSCWEKTGGGGDFWRGGVGVTVRECRPLAIAVGDGRAGTV